MTRSFGTDPPQIRARRRVDAPRGLRGTEEAARRRIQRLRGQLFQGEPDDLPKPPLEPQRLEIVVTPARKGYLHPLSPRDIRRTLEFFAPLAVYGLRSVELRSATRRAKRGVLLARLQVPGRVILYEQLKPPWRLGHLTESTLERLRVAGASVEKEPAGVRVSWSPEALKDFMLFDGLMHEVGHHLIQQHTGKRSDRVMRTADHERRATAFADACRKSWVDARSRE